MSREFANSFILSDTVVKSMYSDISALNALNWSDICRLKVVISNTPCFSESDKLFIGFSNIPCISVAADSSWS